MEVADGIDLELLFGWTLTVEIGQPTDAVALEAAMKSRARKLRDGSLQGIEAIVERQEGVFAKGHDDGLCSALNVVERGLGPPSEHRPRRSACATCERSWG